MQLGMHLGLMKMKAKTYVENVPNDCGDTLWKCMQQKEKERERE